MSIRKATISDSKQITGLKFIVIRDVPMPTDFISGRDSKNHLST